MLKAPRFWFQKASPKNFILCLVMMPLSWVFVFAGALRRIITKTHKLQNKFVICVGNVVIGGSGKTPTAIAIANELKKSYSVCFLTKGYGRKTTGFIKVHKDMNALQTGDEPQLLQQHAQVYLYSGKFSNKLKGIKEDIIIMDDGLQNNTIHKNYSVLMLNSTHLGNGRIFPSGPLRESIATAVKKASCILHAHNAKQVEITQCNIPVFAFQKQFECKLPPQNIVAFSGLANNQGFLLSLQDFGFKVIKFFDFPDHHPYKEQEIQEIIDYALHNNTIPIVTTEKDFVKIPYYIQRNINIFMVKHILDANLLMDIKSSVVSVKHKNT